MADEAHQQERTESASPWRRKQFRERGEVAKSREVGSAALFLAMAGLLAVGAGDMARAMARVMREGLAVSGEAEMFGGGGLAAFGQVFSLATPVLFTVIALTVAIALAANLLQTGFLFSLKSLKPKLSRLNPAKKLRQMFFSKNAAVELGKTLLKVGALGLIGWWVIAAFLPGLVSLSHLDVGYAGTLLGRVLATLVAAVGAGTAAIAALDYAWQRKRLEGRMKMTKEDVKRELKEHQGDPLIKGTRRQRHRQLSLNQILKDVPRADVVIANPTHFAVALRYRPGEGGAPLVVAKGRDWNALRIRREAVRHDIPVVERKPLARALFRQVRVGQEIPEKLFQAVAEVLAYIHQLRHRRVST